VVSRVTAVVTAAAPAGPGTDHAKRLSLGQTLSGWRDLNSRPLDPQSSALPSCATARGPLIGATATSGNSTTTKTSDHWWLGLRHNRPRDALGVPEL
jgi:hypothetical protein